MLYVLHRAANNGSDIVELADSLYNAALSDTSTTTSTAITTSSNTYVSTLQSRFHPVHVFQPYKRDLVESINQRHRTLPFNTCAFRSYPSHRYYGVNDPLGSQPPFLKDVKYIRGIKPIILNPPEKGNGEGGGITKPTKVCIDTTEWEDMPPPPNNDRFPFSDGQNPSIVSLSAKQKGEGTTLRLSDRTVMTPLCEIFGASEVESMFIGVMVVGHAQCRWRMSEKDIEEFHFSNLAEAADRRTIVTVLDKDMETLDQMTLLLEHDAPWGTKPNKGTARRDKGTGNFERSTQYFDDPRFFFHDGQLMMLYRHGPRFGYENQVQNPVHLEKKTDEYGRTSLHAYVKASETFVVCCGRNIALLSINGDAGEDGKPSLKALTWVDPVTVVDVEPKTSNKKKADKLKTKKEKSNIHGTNGWMIPLHATNEFLGIAHFHRPEDRKESEYALHGHHYTHTLFTIAQKEKGGDFQLKRLSNEFLFRAMSPDMLKSDPPTIDAETIQFSSGLDLNGLDVDGRLLISYGVNDCEGGAFFVDMKVVQKMLLAVPEGSEVNDLMAPISV